MVKSRIKIAAGEKVEEVHDAFEPVCAAVLLNSVT